MINASRIYICKVMSVLLVIALCLTSCQTAHEGVTTSSSSQEGLESSAAPSTDSMTVPESSQADATSSNPGEEATASEVLQPDDKSQAGQKDLLYESVKITLFRAQITGRTQLIEVDDDTAKGLILNYVDTMEESSYNAKNTPPGNAAIIDVFVFRNDVTEEYSFSEDVVEGNAIGKNLQDPDILKWTIVNKDAFPYLLSFFPEW